MQQRRGVPPAIWIASTAGVVALALVVHVLAPRIAFQWASDFLQLTLALTASLAAADAARRDQGLGRAFWAFVGLGALTWACGQAVWMAGGASFAPVRILAVWDVLFLASTAPFMAALVIRPDRRRGSRLGLTADLSLLGVALLHTYVYFALGYALSGDQAAYGRWVNTLLNFRGLLLLPTLAWILHGALPPWRRVYARLGTALTVFYAGNAISNEALVSGAYRAGLLDLPWMLPFLWIGLTAWDWQPEPVASPALPEPLAPDWGDTRRGMFLALPAVVLVPAIHFVTIQLEGGLADVAALRLRATLLTTALLGGLFLMRQIHVLKRVEEASRREMEMRQRLLRAERMSAIGMLVAGVAHEINNPLAVVVGQAEVLGRRVSDDANRSRIDAIRDNAERCGRIVRNLLLFARGSSAERGMVNLAELVRQVGELETHDLSMRNIVLELDLDPEVRVFGDGGQIQQILVNLVSNAIHALSRHPGGGRLRLAAKRTAQGARLEVQDDGPGVAPHLRDDIFKPLFTTKPPGEGTGLGLAICQDLVAAHGGKLTLVDPPQGGALFRVDLPENSPLQPRDAPLAVPRASLLGRRVLVVDDESQLARVTGELLAEAGCLVETAASGEEALTRISAAPPEVVVSDVRMPGMGGLGLYRRTLETLPGLGSRFVFMTGDTADPETWRFLSASGCESLQKPYAPEALLDAVARALGNGPSNG